MAVINRELDCISSHENEKGLDWNDVCYSSPDEEKATLRDRLIAKSMNQVIKEHEASAEELLREKNGTEENEDSTLTVDDAAKKHNEYYNSEPSVGDDATGQEDAASEISSSENNENMNTADQSSQNRKARSYTQYASSDFSSDHSQEDEGFLPKSNDNQPPYTDRLERALDNKRDHTEKHFGLGFEAYDYNYKEPGLDVELDANGPFYGVYMDYSVHLASSDSLFDDVIDMYAAQISYSHGYTNYTGSGTIDNEPNSVWEFRGLMGKDLSVSDASRLTPYSGLGFRYLRNDSGGMLSSTGAAGYDRESRYLYLPLGVEFATPLIDHWIFMPSFEMDVLLMGWQASHLTQAGYFHDINNKQRNGYGVRGSLKFIKQGERMDYVFEPFFRHWYIGDSNTDDDGVFVWQEPRNKTTEYGVRLGAQF